MIQCLVFIKKARCFYVIPRSGPVNSKFTTFIHLYIYLIYLKVYNQIDQSSYFQNIIIRSYYLMSGFLLALITEVQATVVEFHLPLPHHHWS